MQFIDQKEQASIILSFEKTYGQLVLQVNEKTISDTGALNIANNLIKEIKAINRPNYFDEDISQFMNDLVISINGYMNAYLTPAPVVVLPVMNSEELSDFRIAA